MPDVDVCLGLTRVALPKMLQSTQKAMTNDEVAEVKEYVEKNKINEIMQQLTAACLAAQPGSRT